MNWLDYLLLFVAMGLVTYIPRWLPLLYLAGLASAAGRTADVLIDGYAMGSLSMTAYTLDARCPDTAGDAGGAAPLATTLPPEDANV